MIRLVQVALLAMMSALSPWALAQSPPPDQKELERSVGNVMEVLTTRDPESLAPILAMIPPQATQEAATATLFRVFMPEMLEPTRVAAEGGDARSQYRLGVYLASGLAGSPKDPVQAVSWFRKSADQGFAAAQTSLGQGYLGGEFGLARDPIEAARLFRSAAESGYAPAQLYFGNALEKGEGTPQDPVASADWYRKAAEAGSRAAMTNLGQKLLAGRGVARTIPGGVLGPEGSGAGSTDLRRRCFARCTSRESGCPRILRRPSSCAASPRRRGHRSRRVCLPSCTWRAAVLPAIRRSARSGRERPRRPGSLGQCTCWLTCTRSALAYHATWCRRSSSTTWRSGKA